MKFILTTLFTILFVSNSYAIECTLPLCQKINRDRALFGSIDNYKFPKYNWKASRIKKNPFRNTVKRISFERPRNKKSLNILSWPLKRGNISSKFGYRRSPFSGKRQHHNGLDISAPKGRLILAAKSGVVTKAQWIKGGCGLGIFIKHGNFETVYCHTSKLLVKKGDRVKRGQRIGRVGSTGLSTGPHLHFEVRKNKKSYDPLKLLR